MKYSRVILFLLLLIIIILPVTPGLPALTPDEVAAASPAISTSLSSQIVCAPETHNSCQPGPYSETYEVSEPTWVVIDVYLVHTGSYENNEISHFFSPFGDIMDCGPLLPGEEERHCGQVVGYVEDTLDLTIEHAGQGSETGSHQQRYDLKLCHEEIYFPAIFRQVP